MKQAMPLGDDMEEGMDLRSELEEPRSDIETMKKKSLTWAFLLLLRAWERKRES